MLTCFCYKCVFMGRAWRIEYEGGLYHVLSCGNERKDIFRDDRDRVTFLDVIGEMADQYHIDIFAYTLMNNHFSYPPTNKLCQSFQKDAMAGPDLYQAIQQ